MKAAIKPSNTVKVEKPNLPHDENEEGMEKTIEKVIKKLQPKHIINPLPAKHKRSR